MANQNIETFALQFLRGEFNAPDTNTQINAGWYDWFCRDSSLQAKTKSLGNKVLQLMSSTKIDTVNNYVFFKNNCPIGAPTYDDFRICDVETGDVIYTVTPRYSVTGQAELYGRENNFDGPIVSGTWKDIKTFFGV